MATRCQLASLLLTLILSGGECVQYLGCHVDPSTSARLLPDQKINFPGTLTVELCVDTCHSRGFRYSGVEWRNECFCSNHRPPYKLLADEEECDLKCDGDHTQHCGGNLRINVYDFEDETLNPVVNNTLGCYQYDPDDRMLKGPIKEMSYLTPEFCVGFCYRRGYRLAGLHNGNECLCGDSLRQKAKAADSECSADCAGCSAFKCGGLEHTTVYLTGIPDTPPSEDSFLGCFKENGNGIRLFSGLKMNLKETNSPRRCMNICFFNGYKFSGVEYSFECFCGNRKPPADKEVEERECQMLCPGNKTEYCGGSWRLFAYSTGYGTVNPVIPEHETPTVRPTKKPTTPVVKPTTPRSTPRPKPVSTTRKMTTTRKPTTTTPAAEEAELEIAPPEANLMEETEPLSTTPKPVKKCEPSETTVNGKEACKGQLIFRDDFVGDMMNTQKWTHSIFMPWSPDYEFVTFDDKHENSYIKEGKLVFKPTLREADVVRNGNIELQNCTGQQYSEECARTAVTYNILPPIVSARIHTKDFFSFKYGVVQIRAKLPVGDWIIPEIWLEPKRKTYGMAYSSGRIRIAMARGNKNLVSGELNLGNTQLESGIMMGVGMDTGIRGRTVIREKKTGWHSQFYNFTLIWTPTNLTFLVDGGNELGIVPDETSVMCDLVDFSDEECSVWKSGSNIAPFDKEFYLSLGLTVGGMRDFPDESVSGDVKKPWKNMSVKALFNFWQGRDVWKTTWEDEKSILQVDSVRVYAL